MKAAVLREVNTPLQIEEIQHGNPGPREVLVRTAAAGVCHSDLHFQDGSYPHLLPVVLGHESAGVVEAVGSMVSYVKPGDHVITCLSAFCGHCEHCLTGHMSLCMEPELQRPAGESPRLAKNGKNVAQFLNLSSFAEYMLVHEHALAKIRKDMPLDRAALIGCAVTTGHRLRDPHGRCGTRQQCRRARLWRRGPRGRQRRRHCRRGADHCDRPALPASWTWRWNSAQPMS